MAGDARGFTVVLDLDETLIHTEFQFGSGQFRIRDSRVPVSKSGYTPQAQHGHRSCVQESEHSANAPPGFRFPVRRDEQEGFGYVWIRPGLGTFLEELGRIATIIVYTAGPISCTERHLVMGLMQGHTGTQLGY